MADKKNALNVGFIHPDLGIGGAERLIVDIALGLQEKGHNIDIFTSHCDKTHCFEEVGNGTLKVQVFGDELPTNLKGKFFILFATLRQFFLVWKLYHTGQLNTYDILIIDQLSSCLPLLHKIFKGKTLFYCHFPDQLLAQRTSAIKKIYRLPFDLWEQFALSTADKIVVNSAFTRQKYKETFKWLTNKPDIIYPCVDISVIPEDKINKMDQLLFDKLVGAKSGAKSQFYLSINRFERKKNIELAIKSFGLSEESETDGNCKLIIAGGYDYRVQENVQYLKQLQRESDELKMKHITLDYSKLDLEQVEDMSVVGDDVSVIFLQSISTSLKQKLLQNTKMLLYTPSNEHFGIVPLEAMKFGKPVLAINSGGPLETIVTYKPGINANIATGWLRESNAMIWAKTINEFKRITMNDSNGKIEVNFHENGENRAHKLFSRDAMTDNVMEKVDELMINANKPKVYPWENALQSSLYFILHMLKNRYMPNDNWVFLILATIAYQFGNSSFWTAYFVFIYVVLTL